MSITPRFTIPSWLTNITLILARAVVGGMFAAHGYQKLFVKGPDAAAKGFERMGIPAPTLSAWFTCLVEFFGGIAFALGILAPLLGVLLAIVMAGAIFFAHGSKGFFLPGGYEYVLVLTFVSLGLGFGTARLTPFALFNRSGSAHRASL